MTRFWLTCNVVLLLAITPLFSEDFITKMEYAKMLYSNPRGIGCNKCHGEKGEGSVIAQYQNRGKTIVLEAPNLTTVSKERFFQALTSQHKVMPTYFLTWQEIDSLYYFVSSEVKK
ncbi:c-type cytochrome [Sulfurospirillum halorespirans]|uniref:Cytochrome-like protein n=1 Tax=Sulfurospirillum halorespirans DSM 13726 TaxID=1193502 RepID=A0A1D7TJ47_9BACT|nr:cytochrome c [Sulfurospirillum halorespirans]AOO64884.1 cytochrome-like protein [Sulfurospirillum halorespirans DSM 13726]